MNTVSETATSTPACSKKSMYFKTADVAGLRIFYREAGDPANPTIVLLHGFPSSTYSFHDLIPVWQIGFMSSRPTIQAWGTARRRQRRSCDRPSTI